MGDINKHPDLIVRKQAVNPGFAEARPAEEERNATETAVAPSAQSSLAIASEGLFPVGWLVVVAGPGRGASFALADGMNQIGSGDQAHVRLAFGDDRVTEEAHALVVYDSTSQEFLLSHTGQQELVRLNGQPVLEIASLSSNSEITIGATTLRFVELCGHGFSWTTSN